MLRPCPACASDLHTAKIGGIERSQCESCSGIWFEAGRLARTTGRRLRNFGILRPSERTCPTCQEALAEGALEPVHVDWCARCEGIFLDAGELEALKTHVGKPAPEEFSLAEILFWFLVWT